MYYLTDLETGALVFSQGTVQSNPLSLYIGSKVSPLCIWPWGNDGISTRSLCAVTLFCFYLTSADIWRSDLFCKSEKFEIDNQLTLGVVKANSIIQDTSEVTEGSLLTA